VQIMGEPGIGKSRLIDKFRARLGETPHTWIERSSSQLLENTPLHPIAAWGRVRFEGSELASERRLAEVESVLAQLELDPLEYAPLLAPLADILVPPQRLPGGSPDEFRRKQLAAIASWALASARVQPIVLAFEDLQWADPSSIELMQALSECCAQAPLLILATARPEFRPPWSLRSHHSVISLAPLDAAQVQRMVAELASRHALSKEVIEGVSERSGGVPLFVEEVTRLILECGEQWGAHAIPPTLQQSLAARLDRLGAAREAAQIGGVLGRDFAYELLRKVAETDEPPLREALERLADADVLIVEGVPPQANYRFKHALMRPTTASSRAVARCLNRRTAEALSEVHGEPEAIAHHFTEAGPDDLAIEWWGKAGDDALHRSAFKEAIAHLGKAIEMADQVEGAVGRAMGGSAVSSQRVKLQTAYGQALMYSKGYAAEETRAAFARAGELASQADTGIARRQTRHAQWARSLMTGEMTSARSLAESLLREAETEGPSAVHARRALGLTCLYQGKLALARSQLERRWPMMRQSGTWMRVACSALISKPPRQRTWPCRC
jgi:predicted ATPase